MTLFVPTFWLPFVIHSRLLLGVVHQQICRDMGHVVGSNGNTRMFGSTSTSWCGGLHYQVVFAFGQNAGPLSYLQDKQPKEFRRHQCRLSRHGAFPSLVAVVVPRIRRRRRWFVKVDQLSNQTGRKGFVAAAPHRVLTFPHHCLGLLFGMQLCSGQIDPKKGTRIFSSSD